MRFTHAAPSSVGNFFVPIIVKNSLHANKTSALSDKDPLNLAPADAKFEIPNNSSPILSSNSQVKFMPKTGHISGFLSDVESSEILIRPIAQVSFSNLDIIELFFGSILKRSRREELVI